MERYFLFFSSQSSRRPSMTETALVSCSLRWTRLLGLLLCFFLFSPFVLSAASRDYFVSVKSGAYANDASSWAKAKNNLQEAINIAWDAIQKGQITAANIYVAAGVYIPSEVAEESGNSVLHTSFKLYPGIHVYGGYAGGETGEALKPVNRAKKTDEAGRWAFQHETILSGDHTSRQNGVLFDWNERLRSYTTSTLQSSYHVLWFATNGFHARGAGGTNSHTPAKALTAEAVVDGFTVSGGNAAQRTTSAHAYGGGAYLTAGSVVRNCVFRRNSATRGGGAVFLDGGGKVEDCYFVMNQTAGVGAVDGNGGALMAWVNDAETGETALARRCVFANNVGRQGGAAYLRTTPGRKLDAALAGCVMARNVATVEAGGAYLDGGVMNHCTVVRNACYGTGVILDDRVTGRSAGVFVAGEATLFNSVLWGGQVGANNNLQIANSLAANQRGRVFYSAIQGYNQSDWTGIERTESFELNEHNEHQAGVEDNYADFSQIQVLQNTAAAGAGIYKDMQVMQGASTVSVPLPDYWKYFSGSFVPSGISDLRAKSVRLRDFSSDNHERLQYADLDFDFDGQSFSGRSTVGAFTARPTAFATTDLPALDGSGTVKTLFVDLEHKSPDTNGKMGASWAHAADNLADALAYANGQAQEFGDRFQVLVKQGTYTPRPAQGGRMRDNSFVIGSQVRLYGGFKSELVGTDVSDRNPVAYPTVLSGAILEKRPEDNVAHVVRIDGASNAVLDGVHVVQGNASANFNTLYIPEESKGAGIYIDNNSGTTSTMSGVRIANVVVAHNRAETASAISVENSLGTAEVAMENVIVHNNTATHTTADHRSAIEVGSTATLNVAHSNVIQNVGHPIVANGGNVKLTNTQVWANANNALDEVSKLQANTAERALMKVENGGSISGTGNLLDQGETVLTADATNKAILTYSETVGNDEYTFPKVNNPVVAIGASTQGDLTLLGGEADFTPVNVNPVVNAATTNGNTSDISGAARDFGGVADVGAKENKEQHRYDVDGVLYVRDRDGLDTNDGQTWGRALKTIRHALDLAKTANAATPGKVKKIYVAAGTYKENKDNATSALTLVPGVDVLGGFLPYGNPGFQAGDRSIANDTLPAGQKYITIIDGEQKGRVLTGTAATEATKTTWEGLTFQNGKSTGVNYGGGVRLEAFNILKNCLVQKNLFEADATTGDAQGGGGVYANANAEVANSIVRLNRVVNKVKNRTRMVGGGVYVSGARFINSLVVENRVENIYNILGAAIFLGNGSYIYNCTVAYNFGDNKRVEAATGGVWDYQKGASRFVNCIFWGNAANGNTSENFNQAGESGYTEGGGLVQGFRNCYHSAYNIGTKSDTDKPEYIFYTHPGVTETNAHRLSELATAEEIQSFIRICRENQPFDEHYNLKSSAESPLSRYCINSGVEEFTKPDNTIERFLEKYSIEEDIVGAERVQDCRVDKGAYEYNGAYDIVPTYDSDANSPTYGAYIYYVNEKGAGQASAGKVEEAACAIKLQKVLDAAGRFVLQEMALHREDADKKERVPRVIVKLAGDQTAQQRFTYKPTRAINPVRENPRDFAFIVPRGVEVWGGYSDDFTKRDLKKYPTTLDGLYQTKDKSVVNCYHILHFTTDTFDAKEKKRDGKLYVAFDDQMTQGKGRFNALQPTTQDTKLPIFTVEFTPYLDGAKNPTLQTQLDSLGRAVIDGIFLEHGQATGTEDDERRGGVSILPGFAHIRNCVVRNNEADIEGGAFYLLADALISGTLLTNNRAAMGGALFVAPEAGEQLANRAKIFTSTIVGNRATERGGGLVYTNNVLANSSVFWHNVAPLQANVSGQLTPVTADGIAQTDQYYYLSYCAVENLRYPGLNNFAVSSDNNLGVRFEDFNYYGLKPYSVLVRNGLPTTQYKGMVRQWMQSRDGSVDHLNNDLLAVSRHTFNNTDKGFIEIGARAFNGNALSVPADASKILTRLYVARPEDLKATTVESLINSNNAIYSQPGSSQGYPFQKLDDALEYIRKARKEQGNATKDLDFEVLVGRGTFVPHRTIKGAQGYGRTNTFLVPEGVMLAGGFDHSFSGSTFEGQKPSLNVTAPAGFTIRQTEGSALLDQRKRFDVDGNNIVEPWEFANQTILSGKVVNSTSAEQHEVYHVVMALANPSFVGTLPSTPKTILIDGITISDGYAFDYEHSSTPENTPHGQTFYRGGGISIVGNRVANDGIEHADVDELPSRNIPLVVRHSQLIHNVGGMGGALFSDGVVEMHTSNVAQNLVLGKNETQTGVDSYKGKGAAFYITREMKLYNTLVVNNEAVRRTGAIDGGRGTLYLGPSAALEISNANFVRNAATEYPSIYGHTPVGNPVRNIYNTIFWGNNRPTQDGGEEARVRVQNSEAGVKLYFSAYQKDRGPEPSEASKDAAFTGNPSIDLGGGNGNIIISENNSDGDGPNFVNPSTTTGVGGYTPTADWSYRRVNLLTDAGWGGLVQDVTVSVPDPVTQQVNYDVTFKPNDAETKGFYISRANDQPIRFFKGTNWLKEYMHLNIGSDDGLVNLRISKDPSPSVKKTYIDIGVYEYTHFPLVHKDVDTIWVATAEKLDNGIPDGSSWRRPTADLQRAIETLLASRNGHQKMIFLIEGEYAPVHALSKNAQGRPLLAFNINTKTQDDAVTSADPMQGLGSLTFRGGWSADIPNTQNVEAYPTILRMQPHAGMTPDQYAHLFYIEDASNRVGKGTDAKVMMVDGKPVSVPILMEGLTFINTYAPADAEGSAIYFKENTAVATTSRGFIDEGVEKTDDTWTFINPHYIDHRLKLNRTQFYLNKGKSAVKIEQGGNTALVVNSLFHSNEGTALDAANTVVINNTFALNKRGVALDGNSSHLYNNILWQNTESQYSGNYGEAKFNAYTGGPTDVDGSGNIGLDNNNDDIQTGPNFVDPKLSATTEADRAARNFHVLPSLRILNRGDNAIYKEVLYPSRLRAEVNDLKGLADYIDLIGTKPEVKIAGNDPEAETSRQYEHDLAYRQRIFGSAIERGAYESFANVQRVVYVDPSRVTANDSYDGTSWEKAYSVGELQSAVNIAAMYSAQNATNDAEDAKSYVFVKQGAATGAITMADGVQLYGSIAQLYLTEAEKTGDKPENYQWSNAQVEAYLRKVKDDRAALASPTPTPTYLEGLVANGKLTTGVLVDGVGVRGAYDQMREVSTSPLRLTTDPTGKGTAVLRNAIIYHFNATQGAVAEVSGGLLYNVLFRNNQGRDGVVHLSEGGRMLNCTVVAEGNGVAVNAEGTTPLVAKSITANVAGDFASSRTGTAFATDAELSNNVKVSLFAPYFSAKAYTDVFGRQPNLNYQLAENSEDIDQTTDKVEGFLTDAMKPAVQYASDLDLLKNPRKLGGKVDRGALETWITKNGNLTVGGTSHIYVTRSHHYPHEGSVMYAVQAGLGFVVDAVHPPIDANGQPLAIRPGYFLLQKGGWYGGGAATLQLAYAALDREVKQEHLLVSLPFAMAYGKDTQLDNVATYDGAARSASNYKAVADNSALWKSVSATAIVPANQGVYAHFKGFTGQTTHRFTSVAASNLNSYVYEERAPKTVTLTQYNATPTNGSALYTPLENMGWNIFGQPYMVSDYATGDAPDTEHAYPMNIPHVLTRLKDNAAQYESLLSWDAGSHLRAGEGVFTQTATAAASEELLFRLPTLPKDGAVPTQRKVLSLSTDCGEDLVTLLPDVEAQRWQYSIGGNSVKWDALVDELPEISVVNGGGRYSLMSAVPVETDLPLAVLAGSSTQLRFSLPDRAAYTEHNHVWLTDRATRTVVDLLTDDYAVPVSEGADFGDAQRFVLRFGGERPSLTPLAPVGHTQKVRTVGGRLTLTLPAVAARLEVFDTAGRLVHRAEQSARLDLSLPDGVYVVRTSVE